MIVKFSILNPELAWKLTYTVRGIVFDRKAKGAGPCKMMVEGTYLPNTKGMFIDRKKAQEVIDAVLAQVFNVGPQKKFECVGVLQRAAQRAVNRALA